MEKTATPCPNEALPLYHGNNYYLENKFRWTYGGAIRYPICPGPMFT